MKKMRKGFTLLELLVVIGVMGILSSLAMIGGQEATNAARATNIADGLEKAASAMMMYYADNADTINEKGTTVAKVIAGANAYLKTQLVATATAGKYSVVLSAENDPEDEDSNATAAAANWYVVYKFLDTDTALQKIIANKATRMDLYQVTDAGAVQATAYDGTTNAGSVAMKVR